MGPGVRPFFLVQLTNVVSDLACIDVAFLVSAQGMPSCGQPLPQPDVEGLGRGN